MSSSRKKKGASKNLRSGLQAVASNLGSPRQPSPSPKSERAPRPRAATNTATRFDVEDERQLNRALQASLRTAAGSASATSSSGTATASSTSASSSSVSSAAPQVGTAGAVQSLSPAPLASSGIPVDHAATLANLVSVVNALSTQVAALASARSSPVAQPASRDGGSSLGSRLGMLSGFSKPKDGPSSVASDADDDEVSSHGESSSDDSDGELEVSSRPASSARASRRFVLEACEGVKEFGSFAAWARHQTFSKLRNEREAVSHARIIDLLVKGTKESILAATELAIRRLAGVHLADACNSNWAVAEAIEQKSAKDSFLSQSTVNSTFRLAARLERVQKQADRDSSAPTRGKGGRPQSGGSSQRATGQFSVTQYAEAPQRPSTGANRPSPANNPRAGSSGAGTQS